MKITPTLNFAGDCREDIQMYEKAFNGKIACLITYRDANDPAYMTLLNKEQKDYIYHAELVFDDQRIIMRDHVDIEFQRKELEQYYENADVWIYHLERIADILNTPKMHGLFL